jgi:tRNA(Ile)-lysidine synthase
VAVGVSGGADSVCLAYLLAGWGNPTAFIVDHGLRAGSAAEAATAQHLLAGFGVASCVLKLDGLMQGSALAARARKARYAALTSAARYAGYVDMLVGHHTSDQAETVLLRRQSGSGPAGLAGMAALSESHDIRLIRPLLGVPPGRLRATLRAAGLGWIDDPSNQSAAAQRNRLRMDLDDPAGTGARTASLADAARQHGQTRAADDAETASFLANRVSIHPEGFAVLSPGRLPAPAMAALIRTISGGDHAPATSSVARLAASPMAAVLGGVRFLPAGRLGPGWLVVREAAAMAPPVAAEPGAVWDNRFCLDAPPALPSGLSLASLGADAVALRDWSPLPSAVLRALPALRRHGVLAAVPHIGYLHPDILACVVAASFIPSHPLAGAPFGMAGRGCEAAGAAPC